MKKTIVLSLLVGMAWVCGAAPARLASPSSANEVVQANIPQGVLTRIFEEAVPLFYSEYAIITSVAELQTGYEVGVVTVTEIAGGNNTWLVSYDGNDLIVDLTDYY